MMNIYRIARTDPLGDLEYTSIIVVAESEDAARKMHPKSKYEWNEGFGQWFYRDSGGFECYRGSSYGWTSNLDSLKVEQIGIASESFAAPVVLTQYAM